MNSNEHSSGLRNCPRSSMSINTGSALIPLGIMDRPINVPVQKRPSFKWLCFLSFVLAFHAGYVNTIMLLGPSASGLSHITGPSSQIGAHMMRGNYYRMTFFIAVCVCFPAGSFLSSMIVSDRAFIMKKSYGVVFVLEALLLGASTYFYWRYDDNNAQFLEYVGLIVTFACGMQNAICTNFSGASIRTTHLTGIATDVGILIAKMIKRCCLKRKQHQRWKLFIFIPSWIAFIVGGIVGAYFFVILGLKNLALIFPSISLGLLGMFFIFSIGWVTTDREIDIDDLV